MRIGVISDIHSNIAALSATFAKFQREKVDKIICIGDVIGIGPYPQKCIEFLMNNEDMILTFVKGNHEKYLINGIPNRNHNEKTARELSKEEKETHKWNHSRLGDIHVEFIKSRKIRDSIEVEGKKIVIEHYPMDENNNFKRFVKNPNADELEELFEDKTADIYLFGHTHSSLCIKSKGKWYINPGSLGCPICSNGAQTGILDIGKDSVNYTKLNVKYDVSGVIEDIKSINYPLCESMINIFYRKIR